MKTKPTLLIISVFLLSISTIAKNQLSGIRIASFNSLFLYDEEGDTGKLPRDRKARSESDFSRLRRTLLSTYPDIVGLQEIENAKAARRIVSAEYECESTRTPGYSQELGLCWKKSLERPKIREIEGLSLRPGLRKGLVGEFKFPQGKISVLVVHLKAGHSKKDKAERKKQIEVLGGVLPGLENFVLLGDFNENLELHKELWEILKGRSSLKSANHLERSDCWQHKEGFIDYLITNLEWKKGSFLQKKFEEDDGNFDGSSEVEKGLSDHCPISAELLL
ncbi:endonuclease [Leptospira wolffii]|uniref:Endonuclease n=1 Tax=Leptospira wolffii TaxID=409998 RepID=A0ABV5BVU0_9LEPT|nr:endonuclease [Leptospira wolffii]